MPGYTGVVSEKDHPLAVRRNVGEPVVKLIREDLFLLAAIGLHAPDLHMPRTLGIEINVISVRRIFGSIIQSFGSGKARLFGSCAFCSRNRVDVEISVALANERQCPTIGRPAVPVRRRCLGDAAWRASSDGEDVDERFLIRLRVVADRKLGAIRRNPVIVIAAGGESGVDLYGLVAVHCEALYMAILIEEEGASIAGPVRRLESPTRQIGDAAIGRIDRHSLQGAV